MQAVVQLNAPPNTHVFTLQARDPDTDHNIHYFIVRDRSKSSISKKISIPSTRGLIVTIVDRFHSWWSFRSWREIWSRPYERFRRFSARYGVRSVRQSWRSEWKNRRKVFPIHTWRASLDRRWKTGTTILPDELHNWNTWKPKEGFRVSTENWRHRGYMKIKLKTNKTFLCMF